MKAMKQPCVMGIVNITPDSFWEGSRMGLDAERIHQRVCQVLNEGGTMLDIGAYSTRPGAPEVTAAEELQRLRLAMPVVHQAIGEWLTQDPQRLRPQVSVDTFRADVARVAVMELGADIINDISGGTLDAAMLPLVAELQVPYVLMHMRGTPQTMQSLTDYPDGVVAEVRRFFEQQLSELRRLEGNGPHAPVILDPGFGFAKTLYQNYELMRGLPSLIAAFPDQKMLVGISRKSMIYKLFNTDPSCALNGTTALNTFALLHGADILRVHDVAEAVEALKICALLNESPTL